LVETDHDVISDTVVQYPFPSGYNRVTVDDDGSEQGGIDDDPLLVVDEYEEIRSAAFIGDCAPH